jgi:hypothetical protein
MRLEGILLLCNVAGLYRRYDDTLGEVGASVSGCAVFGPAKS